MGSTPLGINCPLATKLYTTSRSGFTGVDLVQIKRCRLEEDEEDSVYSNYQEKKLYIHEEGVSKRERGARGVQATETV